MSMTLGDLFEKDRHSRCVHSRQDQGVQGPIVRTDGCEGMGVFAHKVSADDRPNAWGHPASVKIVDAAEAGFVLEHEPNSSAAAVSVIVTASRNSDAGRSFSVKVLYQICPAFSQANPLRRIASW